MHCESEADRVFCPEPVIGVYEGDRYSIAGRDALLDYYYELAYHVTEGYRLILETEHFLIFLDVHGVSLQQKDRPVEGFRLDDENLNPFSKGNNWIDYEHLLFAGERLLNVEKTGAVYLLRFDDFFLKIIPHDLDDPDFPGGRTDFVYSYMLGYDSRITRKCECGGAGELLIDFVSDYVVRCRNCKKSTYAHMAVQKALEEWNDGIVECDLSHITIEPPLFPIGIAE